MTLEELHSHFPKLTNMSLEKNLAMLSIVNEYGIQAVLEALPVMCVRKGLCTDCQAKDTCDERHEAGAKLVFGG